jgi:PAS domain S-box-containing protein
VTPALGGERGAHAVGRGLDIGERGSERPPCGRTPVEAAHAVERLEKGAVAREQPLERRERRRRGGRGLRARRAGEGLRPFERVGQLGHALGGEAPGGHEVRALAGHGHQEIDMRRHETRIGLPEAAGGEDEGEKRLDRAPPAAYDPPAAAPMADPVSRLPAVYFEKLLDNSPDIVVAVDRRGTIVFYNDGARSTLGYSPEEVLGQHVTRLYPDLAEARKVMAAMRAGHDTAPGRVKNFETVFVAKNGARIPVAISGSIIRDDRGEELGSIGFAKDLREIRRHDQLATLGEVAIGIAHEINNPLEVIVNNLNLLESHIAKVTPDEEFVVEGERLDSIHAALARIRGIVSRLVEMAQGAEYTTREYLAGTQMTDLRGARDVPQPGPRTGDPALRGLRILVVDDDLGVCHSLHDLLAQEGCRVITALGGREALAKLETEPVDLVLSDVVMPDLDGYELFQLARKRDPGLPVVLMTAFHFDKDHILKRSRLAGITDVVYKKPIDPPRLREIVKRFARRPQPLAG